MKEDTFSAQIAFKTESFADNPEPRCPCLLLLDNSFSMHGNPIQELNAGLSQFKEELVSDSLAMKRIEVAIITFGPVIVESQFYTAANFSPPILSAKNNTPMGEAIEKGIDLIVERKEEYKANGISYYRPWIFLITDGGPTDEWRNAANLVHNGEESKAFAFFAVGIEGANMEVLRQISVREPLKLQGLNFKDMFQWLSNSMKSVSQSVPGDAVPLQTPIGWAEI
ncbi:hypothetical protein TI05_05265 [Achromatium sp. WMS3]|nr:hypothetical protein TI05_05265 [Achromatium sp. WMS3]